MEYRSQEIRDYIDAHPEYDNIVIVLSGDVASTAEPENFWMYCVRTVRIIQR